ncbi:MAG: serine protease [Gemmatimonadetes bacterium]|nr:serine protease [Gemmatimonadota bacterium]
MTSYRPTALALLGVVFLMFAGCATPYQRYGAAGGFQDVRLAPDLFRVVFLANAFTGAQQAYDYALLRGADLAITHGFTHIALVDQNSSQSQMVYYNEFLQSNQYFYKPGTTLLIRAFCGPPNGVYSLDAGFVADELRRSYGITTTPPDSVTVDRRSVRNCHQVRAGLESSPDDETTGTTTGSGFYVTRSGHILTNAHAVEQCREIRVFPTGVAEILALDHESDLALLLIDTDEGTVPAVFREGRGIRTGASVIVVGFPLQGLVSSGPNITDGIVSATAGLGDDRRMFQMTAPVQPGSSGGPVLDATGSVVGVATATLDAIAVARATGTIPQNVNFAVNAGTVRAFLDAEQVPYDTAAPDRTLSTEIVAARAQAFTVRIECRG